jgi:hypothetical protein
MLRIMPGWLEIAKDIGDLIRGDAVQELKKLMKQVPYLLPTHLRCHENARMCSVCERPLSGKDRKVCDVEAYQTTPLSRCVFQLLFIRFRESAGLDRALTVIPVLTKKGSEVRVEILVQV